MNDFMKLMRKGKRIGEIVSKLARLSLDPEEGVYEIRALAREILEHAESVIADVEGRKAGQA